MITHVAYKEQPSVKHLAHEFLAENFNCDKLMDTCRCPAGAAKILHHIVFESGLNEAHWKKKARFFHGLTDRTLCRLGIRISFARNRC